MRDLAFLGLFAAMLPSALQHSHVGAMLWAWVALISPGYYLYGFAAGIPYNKVVVVVALLSFLTDQTRKHFYFDANVIVLSLFVLVTMLAFLFGVSDSERTYGLASQFSKIYLLCLVMTATIQTRLHIHGMLLAIALGLGIHGALEGLKYIASAGGHTAAAPPSFGDNNNFGLALLMCFPVLLYLYRYSVVKHVRLGLAGGAVLNFVGIMCTNSRGALLGLVAMATAYILRSRRKVSGMLALAAVGGLVLVLAPDRWTQRMDTISNAGQDGSFVGRMVSWKLNTVMALERPLGGGFSALEDRRVFEAYRPRINTTLTIFPVEMPDIALAAHSIYFEALGDNGFPGLLLFVSLLFIAFASLRKVRRLTRDHPTLGWAYDLADTMRLMMIGYTVAGAALSMAYFELFYITITLISVLRHLVVKEVRATVPARSPAPMIGNRALAPAQTRWL